MAAASLFAGCSSGTSSAPSATTVLSSIATVSDLASQLESKGLTCKLEYEGLRQDDKTLSICVINGEQATLTIWDRPEVLEKFASTPATGVGATALGRNWSVDLESPVAAQKVANALGGTVKTAN